VLIARRTAAKSAVNENGDDSELDTAVQQLVDHRVVKIGYALPRRSISKGTQLAQQQRERAAVTRCCL
jgi:hypothetical protein